MWLMLHTVPYGDVVVIMQWRRGETHLLCLRKHISRLHLTNTRDCLCDSWQLKEPLEELYLVWFINSVSSYRRAMNVNVPGHETQCTATIGLQTGLRKCWVWVIENIGVHLCVCVCVRWRRWRSTTTQPSRSSETCITSQWQRCMRSTPELWEVW